MSELLIGKCGFYCKSCPTYIKGNCRGCMQEHAEGDCFTRDCVLNKNIDYCGQCKDFPCDDLLNTQHSTVLDKEWLKWKKQSDTNR